MTDITKNVFIWPKDNKKNNMKGDQFGPNKKSQNFS